MAKKRDKGKGRKKKRPWTQKKSKFMTFLRDYTLIISTTLVILSILLIVFGGLALFLYDADPLVLPQPLRDWIAFIHGASDANEAQFDLCLFPLGILVVIFAGWYMGDNLVKRKQFNTLIEIESKSEFIENLDDVEELAWKLSTKHENRVWEKKKELGLTKKGR